MDICNCGESNPVQPTHTHVFVDLNGLPYLLAEYMDRRCLTCVDRSAIYDRVNVDCSDAMRAVIDISIDDIGSKSDCTPNIVGNNTKSKRLLEMISKYANRLDANLPVLKSGIVIRAEYHLTNQRTGQTIRSMTEDIRINDRNYYIDINQRNFNDNGVVVNFNSSMVSTINEFTHGRDQMILVIDKVRLFYEQVTDRHPTPRIKQTSSNPFDGNCNFFPGTNEEYYYHRQMQNHHYLGDFPGHGCNDNSILCPPSWAQFNQFYHFDQEGHKINLHYNEIYDPMRKVNLIPCGTATINRKFVINPGHRIIFKFSIWKNDVTAIFDTFKVAEALKAKFYNCCDNDHWKHECMCEPIHHDHHCDCHVEKPPMHHDHKHDHHHRPDEYNQLINMLYDERKQNERNGKMISELLEKIKVLEDKLSDTGDTNPDESEPPITPVDPDGTEECNCDHSEINERLDELGQRIDDEDIDPMSEEVVENIFRQVVTNKEGEI